MRFLRFRSYDADRDLLPQWEETQDNLKLTLQRNLHGLHAPMRLLMERKIVGLVSFVFCVLIFFEVLMPVPTLVSAHARCPAIQHPPGHPHGSRRRAWHLRLHGRSVSPPISLPALGAYTHTMPQQVSKPHTRWTFTPIWRKSSACNHRSPRLLNAYHFLSRERSSV
jgi:hypothetical protein